VQLDQKNPFTKKVDVLIVEDSRVIRDYLVYVLEGDPILKIIGTAENGEEALLSLERCRPDVILMDIHMPKVDGFEATRRIMSSDPIPIVICTASIHYLEVHTAMRALEAGALAILRKPSGFSDPNAEAESTAIIDTLKLMSEVKLVRRWTPTSSPILSTPLPRKIEVVAIGASTGGPPAVLKVLLGLPRPFSAPILLVQHISTGFTQGFAEWLATASGFPVHITQNGERPLPGHVYVAPDDHHLWISILGDLRIDRFPPRNGLRPAVSVLFQSVAEQFGPRAAGILLTGMGRDGAEELKKMFDRGALTVAQDEASCVVFGMPGEAIRIGAAQFVRPPEQIANLLTQIES